MIFDLQTAALRQMRNHVLNGMLINFVINCDLASLSFHLVLNLCNGIFT